MYATEPTLIALVECQNPDGVFLEDTTGSSRTYGQVAHASNQWAAALHLAGLKRNDTVISFLPTCPEAVEIWLGIAKAGGLEVPLNTRLRGALLEHQATDSQAEIAVIAEEFLPRFLDLPKLLSRFRVIVVTHRLESANTNPNPDGVVSAADFLQRATGHEVAPFHPSRTDTAAIIYTSGTTGPSKGVIVSWAQIAATVRGSIPVDDLTADDAYYNPFPLFHIGGKFPIALAAALGSRVVLRDGFSTWEFWQDVAKFHCTTTLLLGATANFLYQQPTHPGESDTPLRNVVMVPLMHNFDEFARRFDVRICTTFNMTEISAPLSSEGWYPANNKTSGHPREGYECRVVDSDDKPVPPGTPGELVVRSTDRAALNGGYWKRPEATAEAWRGGWFHTGDVFTCDSEGEFYFVDRLKDAIRRRGENISSSEVESVVLEHECIAECAAHAVPSEWGEDEVKITVVLQPCRTLEPNDLIDYLVPRLADFMVPRYVEFASELPKTPTQKVQKRVLRERGVTESTWDRHAHRTATSSTVK